MLLNVHIKNIALIEDANINFTDGLNILTGETGAGKSIIMGALKIGMGGKLPKDMLRDPEKEGFCQLLFFIDDESLVKQLQELGVTPSEDGEIIITRRIVNGRTMNTINDQTVTAAKLKDVSALLVDMHAQHEQQILLKKAEHLNILDKFAKRPLASLKQKYEDCYKTFEDLRKELEEGQMDEGERKRKLEYIRFEAGEIEGARLVPGEDEELEKQYRKMVNAKDIVEAVSEVYSITGYNRNASAGNEIGRALASLKAIKGLDEEIESIFSELTNIDSLLNDFNVSVSDYMQSMEFDESEFHEVEDRLNTINNLKGKYGRTLDDVLAYLEQLKQDEAKLVQYEEYAEELQQKVETAKKELDQAAEVLSAERKIQAKELCKRVSEALEDLSFNQIRFDMHFDRLTHPGTSGIDDCYFVVSTNVGEKERPLYEVASGGELSRIMLAIKSCMASEDNIDTLIFDEIDVGISGRAASSVAAKLAVISKAHQVISITHLPQIAAMADSHYRIEKVVKDGKTITQISKLDREESVLEIARLLGGAEITNAAVENARDMKELADKAKIH